MWKVHKTLPHKTSAAGVTATHRQHQESFVISPNSRAVVAVFLNLGAVWAKSRTWDGGILRVGV